MSLLLEALKKAEKAKEEASRRTKGEPAAAPLELQQDSPAESRPEVKPVLTRAELPDISRPLEILTEDLTPKPRTAPEPRQPASFTSSSGASGRAAAPRPQAARDRPRDAGRASAAQEERSAAKKMFEVKFK